MKWHPFLFWLAVLLTTTDLQSQVPDLSPRAEFSVLTCGPGTDLYATFGHSAFRLRDPERGIDWVYNYGTFDFHTPNFYMKFARGKLPYALSRQSFDNFLYTYQLEHRWVHEQLLDLTPAESRSLLTFLERNNQPQNRFYRYDFLFENCATKIPEVLNKVLGEGLAFRYDHLQDPLTFRQLIQKNLRRNSWSSFGIDLALGSVIDREATGPEYAFLPEYVESQIGNASLDGTPLVGRQRVILDLDPPVSLLYFTATPLFWALMLLGVTLIITWIDFRNGARSRFLDFVLFLLTGVIGLVISFLWFLTDHDATVWNANLLWAMPLNLIPAFWLLFSAPITGLLRRYLAALLILIGGMLLLWITGLQVFSPVLIPVLTALTIRYAYLLSFFKPDL
ncbi:MAG: DUF4105 domain-containing protein [Bacteroidetes bacterium]|nr:MAG: DUF4105 domain-containing protein [Bacteroidota bacterium]